MAVFKNQINMLLIMKEAVHLQDVLMLEIAVDLNFSSQLGLNIRFQKLFLVKHFQSYDELRLLFSR